MVPYGACFHFIGLFCYKALAVKAEKTCNKRCLEVIPIKYYFLVNIYFVYRYSKIKEQGNAAFFPN